MPGIMGLLRVIYVRKVSAVLIVVTFCCVMVYVNKLNTMNDLDRDDRLVKIDEAIRKYSSSLACKQPALPINSTEMQRFVKEAAPIDCHTAGPDWVVCKDSECRVTEQIQVQKGPVKCAFTDVIRVNDFYSTEGETTNSDSYYKLEKSDVVKVSCETAEERWSSILTGVRFDKDIWDRTGWQHVPEDGLALNVLMFGFDSLSRNTFIRKLPRSYRYLTEDLKGLVLQGYNIVGDGTPQALTPILTGKTELELPDVRKRFTQSKYVDVYPFIWKDFQKAGYVTAFLEDLPFAGIYQYRLRGFDKTPTDHYMRPYYLAIANKMDKWPRLCAGSVPRHKVMLNHIKHIFSAYKSKPKFLFGFHGELSHDDYNLVGVADDDLTDFLRDLETGGALNDTLLILMADHGHRFADIRNTVQGKQEERLPFFAFRFPPWFRNRHRTIYDNFVGNLNTLTTPFDVYSTLKSVLHVGNTGTADLGNRSLSLFSKIPAERSCAHAYIEPHWCACLEWNGIDLSLPIVQRLVDVFVATVNKHTGAHRNLCASLNVSEVMWVTKLRPNDNLLKFKKNADLDGFVADLSSKMSLQSDTYQMKVSTVPGNSLFEASVTHHVANDRLEMKLSDVSRINKYGAQARCIEENYPNLRKYCYCTRDSESDA